MRTYFFLVITMLVSIGALAQTRIKVDGKVTSQNGNPIPASVNVKGTTTGTSADANGNYSLKNVLPNAVLIVSSIGYQTKEIAVEGRTRVDLVMEDDAQQLDEVIMVAYGTSTKETFTGSASIVKGGDIKDIPTTSFESALVGKAPGVNVTQGSATAGSVTSIQIRGIGSMNASTQPLYVIDGVPVSSGNTGQMGDYLLSTNNIMNTLNPEDIASISILKDAAAASLYGSRAANGVVVITTKKGKVGKPTINFKTSIGFSPTWATDNWEPASTQDNIDYLYRVYYDSKLSDGGTAQESNTYALKTLNNRFKRYGYAFATSGTAPDERVNITGLTDGIENRNGKFFDWSNVYFRSAINQTNDLSVSGGNDKTIYFSSFSYSKNQGRVYVNDFDRFSGRVSLTQKIGKLIEFATDVSAARTKLSGFNDTNSAGQNYFEATHSRYFGVYWPTDYKTGLPWLPVYGNSGAQNNLFYDKQWENSAKVFATRAQERLKVNILPDLSLQSIFSYDYAETREHLYYSRIHFKGDGIGKVNEMSTNERRIVSSTTLNYGRSFGENRLNFLAGYEAEKHETDFQRATGTDLPASNLHTVATAGKKDANGYSWGNSILSYISRLEYNFSKKYFLSASFRRDGSSKLGPDSRWGNFWSVGGAWSIDKENFMKKYESINSLRLRASYGVNGTLPPSDYGWRSLVGYSSNYMSQAGGTLTNIADANLSWETNYSTDIALEFGLFKNRIYGTIEYFNRNSKDLLQSVPISRVTGFSNSLKNIGSINNRGVEILLGGNIIQRPDFTWSASVNGSFIKSKVTKLSDGADIIWYDNVDERGQYIYREGQSTLAFYGYEYGGVDPSNGVNIFYVNDPNDKKTGDFLWKGRGATYDYNKANYVIIGDAFPALAGGFNTEANYKGFYLGLNFIYKMGGWIYDAVDQMVADDGLYWERMRAQYAIDDMWTEKNPKGTLPKVRGTDEEGVTQYSSRHLYDATFLRLKNIRLGYNFPSGITRKIGVSNLRVYAIGTNLLTLAKYKHADPEVNRFSTKGWEIPYAKGYTFGLELTF